MFVKITPKKRGDKTYHYAELVESYRENGKSKHKRIMYFGSVDKETAERLQIAFSRDFDSFVNLNKVEFSQATPYGSFYLINSIFDQVDMFNVFSEAFVSSDKHISVPTALEYIKAMIFQRIIQPDSKLALTEWVKTTSIPYFLKDNIVFDLQTVYRSLEVLTDNFPIAEKCLYNWAESIYKQNMNELYYDITSSYFEGYQCVLAEFGYSRDHREDREQLVIGLVTTPDGFPVKCNIYPGSTSDKTTVAGIVKEINATYPVKEFIFVGDRGMLSKKNIEAIIEEKQQYIMALPRAWSKKYLNDITIDEKQMQEIQPNLFIKFLPPIEEQRFLLCLNTQKRSDDTEFRNQSIKEIAQELAKLSKVLFDKKGKPKTRDDTMKKVGAILKKKKAGKYFDVKTKDDPKCPWGFSLEYSLNQSKIESDQRLDGTFVIQTNQPEFEGEKLVKVYKNLNTVEYAFRIIKNNLDIRPMYHRKEVRVKGHVYICVLAYFVVIAIEYISQKKNLNKSAHKILQELSSINLIAIDLGQEKKKLGLTTISKEQKVCLKAFKINKIVVPNVV